MTLGGLCAGSSPEPPSNRFGDQHEKKLLSASTDEGAGSDVVGDGELHDHQSLRKISG
jgi:hypothetical protein